MTLTAPNTATALSLPRLTRNEAQARGLLAQRARSVEVTLGGVAWQLTLEPLGANAGSDTGPEEPWWVRGEWAGAPFEIEMPAAAARSWIRARFPQVDIGALSEPFTAAALEAAAAEVLALLGSLQRGPARMDALGIEPSGTPLPHAFEIMLAREGDAVALRLTTSSLGLMLMAGLVARAPAASNGLSDDSVPVLLRAELGVTWLTAAELGALAVGDNVLIEHPFTDPAGELWLGQDRWGLRIRGEGAGFVVTQTFAPSGSQMTPTSTTAADGDAPVALDTVPLRLAFDLGERSLTLGELKTLQVGQSLDLGRPLSGAVSLRVNGALVGSGDLVEIDGRLGVTITSLGAAAGSAR